MNKGRKIKHYNRKDSIYSGKNPSWIKRIGIVVLIAVLAFIGWSAYDPVMDFLSTYKDMEDDSIAESSEISSVQSSEAVSASHDESSSEEVHINPYFKDMKAVYIPEDYLDDFASAYDYFLEKANEIEGINAIAVDVKNEKGVINLPVKNAIASKNNAVNEKSHKILETIEQFKKKDVKIYGNVCVFKDSVAPFDNEELQIKFMDTEYAWIDRSQENGGKQWLNPYSQKAQDYVIDIAKQSLDMGIDKIIFRNVQFPTGEALEKANYGENSINKTKADAIMEFAQKAEKTFKKNEYYFQINAYNMVNVNEMVYGGNPAELLGENLMITVSKESFGQAFKIGKNSFSGTVDIMELIRTVYEYFGDILEDRNIVPAVYQSEIENLGELYAFMEENNMKDILIM